MGSKLYRDLWLTPGPEDCLPWKKSFYSTC